MTSTTGSPPPSAGLVAAMIIVLNVVLIYLTGSRLIYA